MANRGRSSNLGSEGRSRGGSNSGGNFKNDPQRAAEAGAKGGRASHGGRGRSGGNSRGSEDNLRT